MTYIDYRTLRICLTSLAGVMIVILAMMEPAAGKAGKAGKNDTITTVEFVVRAEAGHSIDEIADDNDLVVLETIRSGVWRVSAEIGVDEKDPDKSIYDYIEDISKDKDVKYAVPLVTSLEDSRFYAWPAGSKKSSHHGQWLDSLLSGDGTLTGKGARIAVLDTGFDMDHDLLVDRWVSPLDLLDGDTHPSDQLDGVDDDRDGLIDEAYGHGTFVAGVIAQLAPGAEIVPIRVLEADGTGTLYDVIDGIDAAIARDVDVINISFGTTLKIKALEEAVKRAQHEGIVVVASAGNAGNEEKQYPAAYGKVIAVAAFEASADGVPSWGTHGSWVDVSAPGVDLISALPGNRMTTWSGSSMAAPVVASQIALMIEDGSADIKKHAEKEVKETARKTSGDRTSKEGVVGQGKWLGKLRHR